jgi:uncharacterized protein (TIGR02231 family)
LLIPIISGYLGKSEQLSNFMKTQIDTKISHVTVYTDRATVTRQGLITLDGSETQLVIDRLPTNIQQDSIRVSGRSDSEVKILSVNTTLQRFTQPVNEKLAEVAAEIESLEDQTRQIQAQIATVQMQSEFITGLRLKTEETFSSGLARQRLTLGDTLSFIDTIGSKYTEYALSIESYRQQHREIDKQLGVLRARQKSWSNPQSTESYSVAIDIAASPGELQIELIYTINGANWKPLYDLRVNTITQQLQLTYLAEIRQQTSEDWSEVSLILSTAQPSVGNIPPELDPWYVDIKTVPRMVAATAAFERSDEMLASPAPAAAGTVMRARKVAISMATADRQGNVVTFRLQGNSSIPHGGNPYKATISQDEQPCKLSYSLMPKLVEFAYLQAEVKNPPEGVTLLAGTANIFRDDNFVGQIELERVAPGQEFSLNLGIDEGVVVDRELVERQVDKKFLGSNRRIVCAYRLKIQNLQSTIAHTHLSEQIPHSRNEKIKIKLLKTEPAIQLGKLGLLEWQIPLAVQQTREIYYQFAIEYPEDLSIEGFDI